MNKKKNIFIIVIALFIIIDLVLCYFVFFKKDKVSNKEYKNSDIIFTYTSDYEINVDDKKISLGKDEKSGQIDIVVTELSKDVLKRDKDIIIKEAIKEFEEENDTYYGSYYGEYKTDKYLVKDFLYSDEENKKQIDLNYIIHDDKLILIAYTNNDKYFDLYSSSVVDLVKSIKVL